MIMIFAAMVCLTSLALATAIMPQPWTEELYYDAASQLTGNPVFIAQNLLLRDKAIKSKYTNYVPNSIFDSTTNDIVILFQKSHGIKPVNRELGYFEETTAQLLLDLYSKDTIKDSGFTAKSMGYKYKFHIPVHSNRSIETMATLYDDMNTVMHVFKVRAHGHRDDASTQQPWPDYGNGDYGLNQFSSNGMTVTGIIAIDYNTPEPDADLYGSWPVNRFVKGLDGNAKFLLPNIRDGILIHTGNWTSESHGEWTPDQEMPNSSGCLHIHPSDQETIYKILTTKLSIVTNNNTFSGKNYPYSCQGIAVVELITN